MELTFDTNKVVGTTSETAEITGGDIRTIMVNGLEGGIGYWACLHNTTEEWAAKPKGVATSEWAAKLLIDGKTLVFTDAEEEDDEKWELTLPKLINGIAQNAKERNHDCDIEFGDATTYDCIIQYALFSKRVFS